MNDQDYWDRLAYAKHDLANCESEPLQFCGAIQPFGIFLAFDADDEILVAASDNANESLGFDFKAEAGKKASDILQFFDDARFDLVTAIHLSRTGPILVKALPGDQLFVASVSKSGNQICVDLENYISPKNLLRPHLSASDPVQEIKQLVQLLDEAKDIETIAQRATDQIQTITGFDRVMIYRFEPNWDGKVIAETKLQSLDPYLGLMYPATDIPAQARKLYVETRFRMIVDVHALPIPVSTRVGLAKSEIDLTFSALRACSPIHIQYLKNMGVRSSFALPIKFAGELWGLVSCHSYEAVIHPTKQIRSACELATQVLSGRIADAVSERRLKIKNEVFELTQSLLTSVSGGFSAIDAFKALEKPLINLADSSGVYVRLAGQELRLGTAPPLKYIHQITEKLGLKHSLTLWESTNVAKDFDLDADANGVGALAVPLSLGFEDLLIWFRPQFVHEVQWGGKPSRLESPVKTLVPRISFKAWTEKVVGQSREWTDANRETAQFLLFTFVQGIFRKAADLSRANQELERATRAKDEFIGTVSHELRTPLGVMMGWIEILRDYKFHDPKIEQAINTLDRNAKLQINLINDLLDVSRIISGKMRINSEPNVNVGNVIKETMASLGPTAFAKTITLTLKDQSTSRIAADPERLRQVVWNLMTNAIKFTPRGGHVVVEVLDLSSSVEIKVTDDGIGIAIDQIGRIFNRFEQVSESGARTGGLGLGLSIVKSLVELHGGRVSAFSKGAGLGTTFSVTFPVYAFTEISDYVSQEPNDTTRSTALNGLEILLAEDQMESAVAMEHMLTRQGATVTLTANGKDAFQLLKSKTFDLLLSDIGMPEWDGYKLITEWRRLEQQRQAPLLPAIALTAYATSQDRTKALKAGFQNHIPKPLDKAELLAVISALNIKK